MELRAKRRALAGAGLAALLGAAAAGAQDVPYPGPWHPTTEAAARAAVARLGPNRGAQRIVPVVQNIVGIQRGVAGAGRGVVGTGSGVVATVQETRRAMQALGARETGLEVVVELPADVLFDFDKAEIRSDAAGALGRLATVVRGFPQGTARLEGHTDAKGDDAYNQRLSERRAAAVKAWLVEREGIEAGRLTTQGLGESKPVASNDDDAGRQRNRRVAAIIRKQ
ncbi:MAG TPA: OmpA family protein [Thermoanaerobaculia bacterium]|nr:OmpA family protein [Thermoanaerobaculia bacterium]